MQVLINPLASQSAGAPSLKYRYVNTETSSPGKSKGLRIKKFTIECFLDGIPPQKIYRTAREKIIQNINTWP